MERVNVKEIGLSGIIVMIMVNSLTDKFLLHLARYFSTDTLFGRRSNPPNSTPASSPSILD